MVLDPRRGADYSHARPTLAQLDRDKIAFCVRYVLDAARDGGKRLTLTEARWLTANGRKIVGNFEFEKGRMSQGYPGGVADARVVVAEYKAMDVPAGRPAYASDDVGNTPAGLIAAYLNGFDSVAKPAGYATGYYGGYWGVVAAYNAGYRWLWQTYGWSFFADTPGGAKYTHWHPHATVRQVQNGAFVDWDGDLNQAMTDDFGQWDTTGWTPGDDMALTLDEHNAVMGSYARLAEIYNVKAALLSLAVSHAAFVAAEKADDLAKAQAMADAQAKLAQLIADVHNIPGMDPVQLAHDIAALLPAADAKLVADELSRRLAG